ncbi:MRN complex-interacting protein [Prunus avium]|uniref:MRN complex-interacting protein n=1 Tax=Prunus avium TaxID=42229 RepID=A0A6P5TAI2_PRUAV|nr:MRN complex-interacting protein [Prunus avium]
MSAIFIAVQCCQCSTMQVKQRKQSSKSNKWTCVVCNQKQSVRQVFAQGPMAKDLRLFVQSSNMPRQQQQQQQQQPAVASSTSPYKTQKKRGTDWTEYLDSKDDQGTNLKQEEDEEGVGFEHEIVTEFPAELSKKRKLNKYGCWSDTRKGDADELHNLKSVFSKRNFNKHVVSPADEEQMKCELAITKETSKWREFVMRDELEPRACQATKTILSGASKWNDYITPDESGDYDLRRISRREDADTAGQRSNEINQTVTNYETVFANDDETVEDDIHPDFLHLDRS